MRRGDLLRNFAELFHDTSWFVNFNGKFLGNSEDHGVPNYKYHGP